MVTSRAGAAGAAALLLVAASPAISAEFAAPADDPLFRFDWQLGAAAVASSSDGDTSRQMEIAPSVRLRQQTLRGGYDIGAAAELFYDPQGGEARIGSATLDIGGSHALDGTTALAGRATLALSQDDADAPGEEGNVASAPLVASGTLEASVTRTIGAFEARLRGSVGRVVNGKTVHDDGSNLDNSFDNVTRYGIGGRLAHGLTPGLSAFGDVEVTAERYDEASPGLGVALDNVTYEGRAGLRFALRDSLELEGSIGLGYRDFANGALPDVVATLYDAQVTYRPDETISLTGSFTTSFSPPGTTAGSRAKLEYSAEGALAYQLNPWLRLRSSAGWSEAHFVGVDTDEYGWNAGLGADYLVGANVDLVADYRFSRSVTTPEAAEDEHRVSVGITSHP